LKKHSISGSADLHHRITAFGALFVILVVSFPAQTAFVLTVGVCLILAKL
jgi:hypothetical protein